MKVYWALKIGVEDTWVADGFNFSESRCLWIKENLIGYATPDEVDVQVVKRPTQKQIQKAKRLAELY